MKKLLNKSYRDIISIAVMVAAVLIIVYRLFDLQYMQWNIPLYYSGGDGMSYLVDAKMMNEEGWMMESSRLAAPYSSNDNDFYASNLHNVDMLILKAIVYFVKDAAAATNILFLSIFPIIALVTYFVLRNFKVKAYIASAGGVLYALTPYVFMRGMGHLVLSSYYFIPLSVLLCVWIFEDDGFLSINRHFYKNWKNWFAIISTVLIANNGIAYYPFFTCFFLVVSGLSKWIKTKKIRYAGKSVTLIVLISGWVVLSLLPSITYIIKMGSNKDAVYRTVDGAESFGLKIAQLLLPVQSHGIEFLDDIITTYNENMPLINENAMSYLGIVGILGFISLLVMIFVRNIGEDKVYKQHLILLSELNIAGVLLGTVGGFSSLFCVIISSLIRCYNRISIFLEFFAVAAICIMISALCEKIEQSDCVKIVGKQLGKRVGLLQAPVVILLWAISIASVYEGFAGNEDIEYSQNAISYTSDAAFMQTLEDTLEDGSMIYQLPCHEYPESGPVIKMKDYDLFRGFVHSSTLRWSYGGTKGRESDKWNKSMNAMPYDEMVASLRESGFSGIYIDRYAYDEDELTELEGELTELLGQEPIQSEDARLSFYYLKKI